MTNDEKIIELKKKIADKKEKINAVFEPKTDMRITLNGRQYDINSLPFKELVQVAIVFNSYVQSAKQLCLLEDFNFSEYNAQLYIDDILARITYLRNKSELTNLQITERELESLLSAEKKTEMAIDKIASAI